MPASPSWSERVAYRAFGVRLDDRWRSWVRDDLADPRWGRRHRVAQAGTFLVLGGLVFLMLTKVAGRLPWSGIGGFVGAFLGQAAFVGLKRSQAERAQLSPTGPFISGPLAYRERVVLVAAVLVLIFGLGAASAFASRPPAGSTTEDRRRPWPSGPSVTTTTS